MIEWDKVDVSVGGLSRLAKEVKRNTEIGMEKCNRLKALSKFKVLLLVMKTLINKNLPIKATMLECEEFKANVGFIIPIK